jgi:MoaA/NifB/PqqE/SkfB family radical SAM enzyme
MSKLFETAKVLHLEVTDVCQAECPLCARETDPLFNKDFRHNLTVSDMTTILGEQFISRLDKMFMCGNYGDPAAGQNTMDIVDYFRLINPSITLGMNTNGGLQSAHWWTALAQRFNQSADYVVFSIDGLADTNHIYRKKVNWDKLIANVNAFIKAGGSAHWDMLVYEHNEHQIESAEQIARDMGFTWFRAKVSKRTSNISWLRPPKEWLRPVPVETTGAIDCHVLKEQSVYMSARGTVYPCCWLGNNSEFTIDKFDEISRNWGSTPNPVCTVTCATNQHGTNFTNQWQRNIALC